MTFKERVREAIANYMHTEGCSCCRDNKGHEANKKVLAELLDVIEYEDGSGYDFSIYRKGAKNVP